MNDDLLVIGGLDQPVPYDHEWLMNEVEKKVQQSIEEKDINIAIGLCKSLVGVGRASGLALAKALYMINKNWSRYEIDDELVDVLYDGVGLHKATIDRYIKVYAVIESGIIPDDKLEAIKQRNIKDLIPISTAVTQGYEIDDKDWEELAEAPDFNSVSAKIREIKGKEPRKGSLQILLRRDGTLEAVQDGIIDHVGYLEIHSKRDSVQKAIERIKKHSGILES